MAYCPSHSHSWICARRRSLRTSSTGRQCQMWWQSRHVLCVIVKQAGVAIAAHSVTMASLSVTPRSSIVLASCGMCRSPVAVWHQTSLAAPWRPSVSASSPPVFAVGSCEYHVHRGAGATNVDAGPRDISSPTRVWSHSTAQCNAVRPCCQQQSHPRSVHTAASR